MKRALLLLSWMALLTACQTQDDSNRTAEQRQSQFGPPESTIPWNKPEGWEQAGALGAMPGINPTSR